MPYAVAKGGWLSLAALVITAVICVYTALLLVHCMQSNSLIKTYPDIGQLAFGNRGRILIALLINAELYFIVVGMLIIEGDNIDTLFPNVEFYIANLKIRGKQAFIFLTTLLVLPTTWARSLSFISYLSAGFTLIPFMILAIIVWVGASDDIGFHENRQVINWNGFPTSLGIFIFSYACHSVIPIVYSSMNDTSKYSMVLITAFGVSTILNVSLGVIGYMMFGVGTKSMVTLNLPSNYFNSKIVIWIVIVFPLVKYALLLMPVINALEEKLTITGRFKSILLRTTLVISTAIIAMAVPFFEYIITLTGSLLSCVAAIIVPCICYLKIFKSARAGMEVLVITCIIVFGVVIAITGTFVSTKSIIQDH
ncbi:Lysine histidine transporter 1 [Apostasia shenzhenica]|uniref:Lysine histidine transporter 1 n=1 Tax=Apostasia shenzhenica TaxID=1088818 RepID=A0A2I0AEE8_9ASPA|nr:Lysine histidine transporter 1 [Apostasia shenzhenica]